jgi:integrase
VYDRRTRRKIRKTFSTAAAARAWRADALQGVRRGTLRAAEPTTVNDAADELVAGMEAGSIRTRSGDPYKPSAIRGYRSALRDHVRPAIGAMRLADVRRRHVQALADRLIADGYSPSTVRNALLPLRVIYRRALRDELVASSPCDHLELPASRGRRDRIVGVDVAAALIEALPTAFDRALWATALYAGLRRGELLALRWQDVDLAAGQIRVERAYDPPSREFVAPKSRAGRRRVPIAAALRHALLEHRIAVGQIDPGALVFGEGGRPFGYDVAVDRAAKVWALTAVGAFLRGESLPVALEPIGLHEARHTAASTMIAAGVNLKALSEFLGHASITTTLDRYGHLLPGSLSEAATRLDAYLDRTGEFTGERMANPLQIADSGRSPKP